MLHTLMEHNPGLLETAVRLHQQDLVPANSYLLDLDTIRANADRLAKEAEAHGLQVFAMTKQIGRNPPAMRAMADSGINRFAAVDIACALAIRVAGHRIGNVGHLTQIPKADVAQVASWKPSYWTVFSHEQAQAISRSHDSHRSPAQPLLLRVRDEADVVADTVAGWRLSELPAALEQLGRLRNVTVAGVTAFPGLMVHQRTGRAVVSPNLRTATAAAATLIRLGIRHPQINAPGHNAVHTFRLLAAHGVTQVEPGHAFTGTTPFDTGGGPPAERPAVVYLSEVSHVAGGAAYCFGGGLYVCAGARNRALRGLVGRDPESFVTRRVTAAPPEPPAIDFYARLHTEETFDIHPGDTVVFAFRPQAFVTRANIVPLAGLASGRVTIEGIWSVDGRPTARADEDSPNSRHDLSGAAMRAHAHG